MRLQLGFDLVANTGIHVIGTSENENAWLLILCAPGENLTAALAGPCGEILESLVAGLNGSFRFIGI